MRTSPQRRRAIMKRDVIQRIKKNLSKLEPWAQRHKIEAYRIYERDIPEYPYIVDRYGSQLVVYDRGDQEIDSKEGKLNHFPELIEGLRELFSIGDEQIIIKRRARQKGDTQYEKIDTRGDRLTIQEGDAKFWVNLHDYLDTGLFLDHRLMRERIRKEAKGKQVLNLFCYTGSVSVFAALGGGRVTSVDMSPTYIKWAQDNFALNEINAVSHTFITRNALEYLADESSNERFDIIFLDPPTFSNSKKMAESFEVERAQEALVKDCMRILNSNGTLYFSNNKRSFKIAKSITDHHLVRDITSATLPKDFRDPKIHHVFEIRHKLVE